MFPTTNQSLSCPKERIKTASISPGLPGRAVKPALNAKAMPAVGVKGC